ncbi:MAG TPA: hypothetical protein VFV46_12505 [Lacibacter sp.]|nr:hypothetical protein [Lacibacter sp.]
MKWSLLAGSLLCTLVFISCKLKRPSLTTEFPGKVSPTIACPGQNITIEWDAAYINANCAGNGAACKRDPLTVEVSGTGGISFKESPAPASGTHSSVVSGTEDATITIHAFDTDQDLGSASVKINVLSPGELLTFDAVCEGICAGDMAAWKDMAVDFKDQSLSDLIALKQLTNSNKFDIELTIYYQNGETATINLKAGATSSLFTSRVAKVSAKNKAEINVCKGGAPPSSIKLQASYGCL